jgi:hypothetical protein
MIADDFQKAGVKATTKTRGFSTPSKEGKLVEPAKSKAKP